MERHIPPMPWLVALPWGSTLSIAGVFQTVLLCLGNQSLEVLLHPSQSPEWDVDALKGSNEASEERRKFLRREAMAVRLSKSTLDVWIIKIA